MKKILAIFLGLLLLCFAGCGKTEKKTEKKDNTSSKIKTVSAVDCDYEWKTHPGDYKLIALTFDDAPYFPNKTGNYTVNMIKTLKQYEGAGTLFVIGKKVENNGSELLRYAVENGFELGNHSYGHDHMGSWNKESCISNITRLNNDIKERMGVELKWFRPPFIETCQDMFDACTELNMPVISGSKGASLHDGTTDDNYDSNFIYNTCVDNAYDGQIVLMHSFNKYTAAALPLICKNLYDQNYRFVTLSELFEFKGVTNIPTDHIIVDSTCN